jgi:hypothetical protein
MAELIPGPVQKWEPSEEGRATIEKLLASEDELDNAYGEAYSQHCYVKEFTSIAAVGEFDHLVEAEVRLGIELNVSELTMGECVELGACPGTGSTRAEAVRDGLRQVLEFRETDRGQS